MVTPIPPFVREDLDFFEDPETPFAGGAGETPAIMLRDAAYAHQWTWWARHFLTVRAPETPDERRGWADWWGLIGRQELDLQVAGCSHALAH